MIAEKSAALIAKINRWNQAVEEAKHVTAYRDRQNKLEALIDQLTPIFRAFKLLSANRIGNFTEGISYIMDVKTIVLDQREQFRTRTNWGTESQVLTNLQRKVDYLKDLLTRQANQEWAKYVDDNRPAIQEGLLQTLRGIPGFQTSVSQILTLLTNMGNMKLSLPDDQASIDQVKTLNALIMQAWNSIGAANIPGDVLLFLQQAASPSGVTLEAFTDTVRTWLIQHQLTSHFSIRTMSG